MEVARELAQRGDLLGQDGADVETTDCLHEASSIEVAGASRAVAQRASASLTLTVGEAMTDEGGNGPRTGGPQRAKSPVNPIASGPDHDDIAVRDH